MQLSGIVNYNMEKYGSLSNEELLRLIKTQEKELKAKKLKKIKKKIIF